ncbi:RING-H2 finger protein ATL3 [Platanthera zijinensis]|uniref:RING-H2 finger protein ATL3 n=1 Tax=Platanthera zijinensis TaxID=2320716 RepID=A0AAP0G8I8_9ASPA
MLGSGLNLITTVVGFGMSVTFIVFILARLICGRIRYSESRTATLAGHPRPDFDLTEHAIPSLESVDVAAIPTMKYHREAFHPKGDAQCSICLAEYEDKEMLRIMPACLHNFHLTCIDVWLEMHSTCPICRLPLNSVALQILGAEFTGDHTNSRFPSTHQLTGSNPRNHEIDESISVASGVPHGEHESGA